MRALISCGVNFFPSMSTDHDVSPMWRLTERMVRSGLVMAWRLATSPTSTSPVLEKPTTEGVVRPPSALGMTVGSPASRTATTELVVPRSMPTALGMVVASYEILFTAVAGGKLSHPLTTTTHPGRVRPALLRNRKGDNPNIIL